MEIDKKMFSFINGEEEKVCAMNGTIASPLGQISFSYEHIELVLGLCEPIRDKIQEFSSRLKVLLSLIDGMHAYKEELLDLYSKEQLRSEAEVLFEWQELMRWRRHLESLLDNEQVRPKGTVVVLSSYMQPIFHFIKFVGLNLVAGNACIVKPSEKSTATTLYLAKKWILQFPELKKGIHIVLGDKEMGRRLATHAHVNAVIFCGSFENGIRVRQETLSQVSKEVLLYLGAKNASIILPNAHLDLSANALIMDAFLFAGQSCRSVSLVFVPKEKINGFVEQFHDLAKKFKIGSGRDTFMGGLSQEGLVDRYLKFCGISEREGGEVIMRGKLLDPKKNNSFVTPTIVKFDEVTPEQMRKSVSLQSEVSAPHVSIVGYESSEDLEALLSLQQTGLVRSVWGVGASKVVKTGINRVFYNESALGLAGSHMNDEFQATKKSGNHAFYGMKLLEQLVQFKND